MKILKRLAALLLAALMLASVCACAKRGNEGEPSPEPTKAGYVEPDAAGEARIIELAAALERFGGIDPEFGVTVNDMEYMVYCWYCDKLEECETPGFGKVSHDEADSMLRSVFGNDDVKIILRTNFDPIKDQNYYSLNGYYYVRIEEPLHEYSLFKTEPLKSEEGEVIGTKATVDALTGGERILSVILELGTGSDGQYYARSCLFEHFI